MDLMRLRTVQWVTILGGVASVLSLPVFWQSPYRSYIIAGAALLLLSCLLLELHKGRISVLFSGVSKFYQTFPEDQNRTVFPAVEGEYCYLGISFTSVLNTFRSWHDSERRGAVRVRLLLTDPEADDVLKFQARYEHGLLKPELTAEERRRLDETVARAKNAINLTLHSLAALRSGSNQIEVRLHREKLREWMHLVDGSLLYVGLLRVGETGQRCQVIVLKKRRRWSMFDHYCEQLESIWNVAKPVSISPPRA